MYGLGNTEKRKKLQNKITPDNQYVTMCIAQRSAKTLRLQ